MAHFSLRALLIGFHCGRTWRRQEQWDKIVGSLGSSASPPFLSLVTVVVAALSFLIG